MGEGRYWQISAIIGWISGGLTFLISWGYCAANYGFLLGFGLGWLPGLILGGIVGVAMFLLWPLVAAAVVLLLGFLVYSNAGANRSRAPEPAPEQPIVVAPPAPPAASGGTIRDVD